MWYGMGGWAWGWWVIGIIILIAIIWSFAGIGGRMRVPENPAEQILKQRYASGEITRDEYRERLREIRGR